MSSFSKIATNLRTWYDRAIRMDYGDGIWSNAAERVKLKMDTVSMRQLVFSRSSPDYCRERRSLGWPGTKGRMCSRTKEINTSLRERRSCKTLCRACGYRVAKKKKMFYAKDLGDKPHNTISVFEKSYSDLQKINKNLPNQKYELPTNLIYTDFKVLTIEEIYKYNLLTYYHRNIKKHKSNRHEYRTPRQKSTFPLIESKCHTTAALKHGASFDPRLYNKITNHFPNLKYF
ncbi:hypothetical protein ANN_14187 [Periplaneta americana]|uniref:Protein Wnt n=1 Tax=Periplaneta americana TaxID=6978 RepID=A0ABQ8SW72_PERAM|nr:hypothetical protein ANN_14187 [Periplaneta americana]